MRISGTPAVLATWLLTLIVAGNAMATTTGATVSAFVSGHTLSQSDTQDKQGAQASIERLVPGGATIRAQASSTPGTLQAEGFAASDGLAGGFQGNATASWSDSFVISAPGHDAFQTGTFSGSVSVSGHLLTEILGRAYSDAQIYATVDLFPGTGFNGGRTTVTGSARSLTGYDIAGGKTGTENFSLVFADVPFTFNQRIDVTLSLTVSASVDAGTGAVAASIADYGSTMTWAGLSHVLDQRGTPLLHYAALSAESGFNFAPVPEPSHLLLVTSGLLVVLCRRTKCLRR